MKKALLLLSVVLCLISFWGCENRNAVTPTASAPVTQPTETTAGQSLAPAVDGWTPVTQLEQTLHEGVNYTQILFRDNEQLPHMVHILTVDPQKATLHKGTANNELSIVPSDRQNVREHMQASVKDGLQVVAAVNGDFFAIESTYMPSGFSVKNGVVLRENTSYRPYCAITREGAYIVADASDKIDPRTLEMATGGSHILVRDGILQQIEQESALSTVSHPRTLSGVRADGTILLLVIDGRQPELSNGATLTQCAQLMHSMGAVQAINHDGGGSSTMILRNGDDYTVANSPSDGQLRDVFCSIQILLK